MCSVGYSRALVFITNDWTAAEVVKARVEGISWKSNYLTCFSFLFSLFRLGTALGSEIGQESVHSFAGIQPEEGLYGGW